MSNLNKPVECIKSVSEFAFSCDYAFLPYNFTLSKLSNMMSNCNFRPWGGILIDLHHKSVNNIGLNYNVWVKIHHYMV